jgi:hypothetical protein
MKKNRTLLVVAEIFPCFALDVEAYRSLPL